MSAEEWRPWPEDPRYHVSNMGRVRSTVRTGGKPFRDKALIRKRSGHIVVTVGKDKQALVHRMVLTTFAGPAPIEGMFACHNNGNPSDNRLSNLRWDTASGNAQDKSLHGTHMKGTRHHKAKLTEAQVRDIYRSPDGTMALAAQYGMSPSAISSIRRGVNWTHITEALT